LSAPKGRLPRRRSVPRHPGIYYRPRRDGKVAPPYEICYLDSTGTRRWETVHGNLDVAEARRSELRLRRRRGERIEPTRQTFEQYAMAWLDRQDRRPRTLERYSWALRCHLIPYFGPRRLDQITCDDIAAFIAAMNRKQLKGWTITSALGPLSIILGQAARRGQIPVNPFSQLERGERPRHDDQRPKRILSLEEMQALLAATESMPMRCLFELVLASGVRISEALGLTVQDLDLKGAIIHVERQLARNGTRTAVKTPESRRAIDIPPRLMRKLRALLIDRGALFTPEAFLFASRNDTGLQQKVVRAALTRAIKASAIAAPAPIPHDLRHTHASMLIALGVSVVDVCNRLGHKDPTVTLAIYAHEWKLRNTQRSRVGADLGRLFADARQTQLTNGQRPRLALPPATTETADAAPSG